MTAILAVILFVLVIALFWSVQKRWEDEEDREALEELRRLRSFYERRPDESCRNWEGQ